MLSIGLLDKCAGSDSEVGMVKCGFSSHEKVSQFMFCDGYCDCSNCFDEAICMIGLLIPPPTHTHTQTHTRTPPPPPQTHTHTHTRAHAHHPIPPHPPPPTHTHTHTHTHIHKHTQTYKHTHTHTHTHTHSHSHTHIHTCRGLVANFCKNCGEMRRKNENFHRVFHTSFCGECGESR